MEWTGSCTRDPTASTRPVIARLMAAPECTEVVVRACAACGVAGAGLHAAPPFRDASLCCSFSRSPTTHYSCQSRRVDATALPSHSPYPPTSIAGPIAPSDCDTQARLPRKHHSSYPRPVWIQLSPHSTAQSSLLTPRSFTPLSPSYISSLPSLPTPPPHHDIPGISPQDVDAPCRPRAPDPVQLCELLKRFGS